MVSLEKHLKIAKNIPIAGFVSLRGVAVLGLFAITAVWAYYAFASPQFGKKADLHYTPEWSAVAHLPPDTELLPDLVPLPPQDLAIVEEAEGTMLRFSATYYNQGFGPLELHADPEMAGTREDVDRDILQRIYRADGSYRDRRAGVFLWHEEHRHFHFSDFALYTLKPVDQTEDIEDESLNTKATFCVRDVSIVHMRLKNRADEAGYRTCGRELQGVSVGWGDSYLAAYPGQSFNISALPSGTYRLVFHVNPLLRFYEERVENNSSNVLISINKETGTVEVLEENPRQSPAVEHLYLEQVPEEDLTEEGL